MHETTARASALLRLFIWTLLEERREPVRRALRNGESEGCGGCRSRSTGSRRPRTLHQRDPLHGFVVLSEAPHRQTLPIQLQTRTRSIPGAAHSAIPQRRLLYVLLGL